MTEPVEIVKWVCDGEHPCPDCAALNGKIWRKSEPHPAPPLHQFCQCALETELADPSDVPWGGSQTPPELSQHQGCSCETCNAAAQLSRIAAYTDLHMPAQLWQITPTDRQPLTPDRRHELRAALKAGTLDELRIQADVFCATYPNANFVRFPDEDLTSFAESFVGQPFLRDHNDYEIEARGGITLASRMEGALMVQEILLTVPRDIEALVNGQIDRFSIAWQPTHPTCTVCGQAWLSTRCEHWPGKTYDGQLCELLFKNPRGKETSAVNTPAVAGTGIRSLLSQISVLKSQLLEATMPDKTLTPTPEPAGTTPPAELYDALRDTLLTARLTTSGLPAALQDATRASLPAAWTLSQLDGMIEHQKSAWAKLSADSVIQGAGAARDGRVTGMTTGLDTVQSALDWIFGTPDAKLPPPALRRVDRLYEDLTGDVNWRGAFDPAYSQLATANSTTLADMAANAMNKIVIATMADLDVYRWYERITAVQPNDGSTQSMAWIHFGGTGDLPTVAEGAAYTEGTPGDSKETSSFTKKGKYVGITLEMIRRSDIAKMRAIPRALTIDAIRTRSAAVAYIFTQASGTGPTLDDDSTVLFHSDHGSNVQTTALGTTLAAWTAARVECAKHSELGSSKRLGLIPKYLLVPIDLYDQALVLFSTQNYPGTANNDKSPLYADPNAARPEVIMVPDWTDTNNWAYLTDPKLWPVIQMSYAQDPAGRSHPAPEIFSVSSETSGLMFSNDVLPVKVRDWWALGVSTWRGIGKRNVT